MVKERVPLVAMLALLVGCGVSGDPSQPGPATRVEALLGQVESLSPTQVRTTVHGAFDMYAKYLKWKVDLALAVWEFIPTAQRRAVLQSLVERLKAMDATLETPVLPSRGHDGRSS